MGRGTRRALLGLLAALLLPVSGCGGGGADPGPAHVHGLGFDERTRTLYLATHRGMYELPPHAARPVRIGRSAQDTMGFTLLPSGRFLGSGHPDARSGEPPHLGLIESSDRGRSWRPVSLSGEADFHVLRASASTVYGFDASSARLLASGDGGRTWQRRTAPDDLVDLAIHPSDPSRLLAAAASGVLASSNGGRSWRPVAPGVSGLLAWPAPGRLYLAREDGAFLTSERPDGPWRSRAPLDAPVAALHAAGASRLFAALHDGTVVETTDGGGTWELRSTPEDSDTRGESR